MIAKQEIREGFDQMIAAASARAKNADLVARLELAREFFTNEEFRHDLEDYVWSLTNKTA